MGSLHLCYEPCPGACASVHCNWSLLSLAVCCVCSSCGPGYIDTSLVLVVGFKAVMTLEHFALCLYLYCVIYQMEHKLCSVVAILVAVVASRLQPNKRMEWLQFESS